MLVWAIDEAEQVVLLCASMADVAPNQPSPVQFQQHRPSHRFHVMSLRLLLAWHGVEMRQRKLPFVIRCYSMSLKIPIGMFFLQERDSQLGLRVSEVKSINFYMLSWARLIISMDVMLQTGLSFTASVHMPPIFPFLHIGSIRGPCLLASTNISTSLVLRHLHFLKMPTHRKLIEWQLQMDRAYPRAKQIITAPVDILHKLAEILIEE